MDRKLALEIHLLRLPSDALSLLLSSSTMSSSSAPTTSFKNVRLLSSISSPSSLYDVLLSPSGITSILPASSPAPSALLDHLPQLWDTTTIKERDEITEINGMGSWLMPG